MALQVTTNCGLLNPSFEEFAVVGRPLGWAYDPQTPMIEPFLYTMVSINEHLNEHPARF